MNVVNFIVIGVPGFDLFRSIRSSHQILFCLITHRQRIEVLNNKSKGQLPRSTSSYLCSCHEVLPVIKPVECLGFTRIHLVVSVLATGELAASFVLDIDFH